MSGCADFLGIAAPTQKCGTVRITPGLRFIILQLFLVGVQTSVGLAFHLLLTLFHMFILKCAHFSDFPGKDGSLFTFREGGTSPDAMDLVQTQWFFLSMCRPPIVFMNLQKSFDHYDDLQLS